ncbi:MAG: hypothetical protein UHC59_00200 [Fibrobacteraceae bacterium]|jgi:hypothetical protein|nr:hypothetical protein [Fibrobacteraceae bacterium]MEE1275393.1 hypothetical protein [Fibrobacteraceae bacterium]
MKKIFFCSIVSLLFFACSSEEKQPLPDLPKIEKPKGVAGLYAGRLPLENAKAHQIQLQLDSIGNAFLTERILYDSLETRLDTLTYQDSSSVLIFKFKSSAKVWKFKQTSDLQYVFLNPTGEPFLDADSNFYTLFRMLKTVEK